jgi:phosphatidylglycerol:prolipoprotein diacylglycerol transferase
MAPAIRFFVGGWCVVVSTHAVMVVVAVVVGAAVAVRRACDVQRVMMWAPVVAGAALAGSRLLYDAVHGGSLVGQAGGLSSMGGVAAIVVVLAVAAHGRARRFADLADAFAPAGVVALGIGRLGCFLAGCCWGMPTDLPWGVVFAELGPPARHPLQLYSAAVDAVLGGVLLRTRRPPGVTAAYAAIGLGGGRLMLEMLRDPAAADPLSGGLRIAQAGGLCLLIAGSAAAARLRRAATRPGGEGSPARA